MQKTQIRIWYDHAIRWLLLSVAAVIPAFFSTAFYSPFAEPKLLVLRVITLLVVLLWTWKIYREGEFYFRRGAFNWALLTYGIILAVTTVTSTQLFTSLFGSETRFLGIFTCLNFLVLAFLAYQFLREKEDLRALLLISFITGSALAIYGILQSHGVFQQFVWSQNPEDRAFGTMGHSNHFGAYLGICFTMGIALFFTLKKNYWKWLLTLGEALMLYSLILTGSRAAFFATVISALVVGIMIIMKKKEWLRVFFRKRLLVVLTVVIILIGAVAIFSPKLSELPLVQRLNSAVTEFRQNNMPDRVSWWLSSLSMLKDRPVLGFGVSAFRDTYNTYRRLDYTVPGPGDIQYQISPESSHMEYLDIAVNEGIIGLVAYLTLIGIVILGLIRAIFKKKKEKDEWKYFATLAFMGALMTYLLQAFLNFGVVDTLTVFYLLLGGAVSISSLGETVKKYKLKPFPKTLIAIAALILVVFGTYGTFKEAAADWYYKQAAVKNTQGQVDNARDDFDHVVKNQPYQYEYHQDYGDFAFKVALNPEMDSQTGISFLELAIQQYREAAELNASHPSTFYNMGIALIQLAAKKTSDMNLQQGINALKKSIDLSPNNPLYRYEAGKIFLQLGRKDLAEQAFTEAEKINPGFRDVSAMRNQASN